MIDITEMTEASVPLVAELEAKCFSDPWPCESFINTLSNDHAQYFTAYNGSDFLGYIGMYDLIDEVSIINVAVDPAYRNSGIGKLLMKKAEEYALIRGCPMITLEVRQSNDPARRLYESLGYEIYGYQKDYYSDPKEDAVLYRNSLSIVPNCKYS